MNQNKIIKILVILGPTATGKSDLAVELARIIEHKKIGGYVGAEIISADSRQVYKGLNIGTGKITQREMKNIRHHLLDVADPRKQFTVIDFKRLAEQAIYEVTARGKLPIICGGTGFYIDTLINNAFFPKIAIDKTLRKRLAKKTIEQLFIILQKIDPQRALAMNGSDNKNVRRLIRAIEIARAMNKKHRQKMEGRFFDKDTSRPVANATNQSCGTITTLQVNYRPIYIGLIVPPAEIRKRIHDRLIKRLNAGMLNEAYILHKPINQGGANLSWKRMQELGLEYRYQAQYLQGKILKEEMIEKLETMIWRYAKRQKTWFKRNMKIRWFRPSQLSNIKKLVTRNLSGS